MANEFVIKNGYFSQGNSNVTGSLQVTGSVGVTGSASITGSLTSIGTSTFSGSVLMTGSLNAIVSGAIDLTGFITASKILITSSGNEQLIVIGSGSSSWITGIYGSQGNLLTVTDTFSGSIFTVTDISGYPILDITSDYYTGSVYLPTLQSQSQQNVVVYNSQSGLLSYISASAIGGGGDPFPYTGSAEITGSLIVSGGFIVHDVTTGFNNIDSNNTALIDSTGVTSLSWASRELIDTAGTPVLNWGATGLYDTGNSQSMDWSARTLIDSFGTTVGDWENRRFWDGTGNRSLDWDSRLLYDSAATQVFDWNTPGQIVVNDDIIPGGPYVDNTSSFNLGSLTAAWDKIYVSNNSLHFVSGSVSSSIGFNNGVISFNNATVNIPTGSTVQTASYALTASYVENGGAAGVSSLTVGTGLTGSSTTGNINLNLSATAYTTYANNTAATATPSLVTFKEVGEQAMAATITWNGTPPSGVTNLRYRWFQIGNMVQYFFFFNYGTGGLNNSTITFDFPADMPTPTPPTGTGGASTYIYRGQGLGQTSPTVPSTAVGSGFWGGGIRRDSGNTKYEFFFSVGTAIAARAFYHSGFYFV